METNAHSAGTPPEGGAWTLLYDTNLDGEIDLLRSHLKRSEWRLLEADSASNLLAKAKSQRPHVVLASDQTPSFWRAIEELVNDRDPAMRIVLIVSPATSAEHKQALRGAGVKVIAMASSADLAGEIARLLELRTRTADRVQVALDVQGRAEGGCVFRARSVDVSTGGVRLRTGQLLPAGSLVRCFFTLAADTHQIFATGRVVYSRKLDELFEYGVEFAEIGMQDRLRIANFVLQAPDSEARAMERDDSGAPLMRLQ